MLTKDLIQQVMKSRDHCLQKKNRKIIGLMKDELGGKFMTKFVGLSPKAYSYFTNDSNCHKKAKGTKKCVIKRILKFNDYKNCLLNNEILLKSQQKFRST